LREFPELASDPGVVELAARDFQLRRGRGEAPAVDDYLARFPLHLDPLLARLRAEEAAGGEAPAALPEDGVRPPRHTNIRRPRAGGLGEVFVADDTELGREVALKRVLPKYADDPSVLRRFFREAEITARLDHPGVAPIHEVVRDRDRRPWYVMRLVRGQT